MNKIETYKLLLNIATQQADIVSENIIRDLTALGNIGGK